MAEFGERLRLAREERGVTLDSLSAETRVNLRHLEALEQGNFETLPGGVFRRGMLRAYLRALHLEETEWLPDFEASLADYARTLGIKTEPDEEAWITFASNVKKNRMRQKDRTGWRWAGVALLFLALLAASWALWVLQLKPLLHRT